MDCPRAVPLTRTNASPWLCQSREYTRAVALAGAATSAPAPRPPCGSPRCNSAGSRSPTTTPTAPPRARRRTWTSLASFSPLAGVRSSAEVSGLSGRPRARQHSPHGAARERRENAAERLSEVSGCEKLHAVSGTGAVAISWRQEPRGRRGGEGEEARAAARAAPPARRCYRSNSVATINDRRDMYTRDARRGFGLVFGVKRNQNHRKNSVIARGGR